MNAVNGNAQQRHVHVVIIGAGLTGLILAQTLRKFNQSERSLHYQVRYTFSIYERDPCAFYRGGGWSLTIHWALTDLSNIMPRDIMDNFAACLVNRDAADNLQPGNFQYLNLQTGQAVEAWPIPLGAASRVAREKLIALLMTGLDIQWSKHLIGLEYSGEAPVTAKFDDGTSAKGDLVVGCDGSRSAVRRSLCPNTWQNTRLPVRLIGLRVLYPIEKIRKCLAIDPHFYQGGDPSTNVYFWFSFIHMPRSVDTEDFATCQMMLSWPYRDGWAMPESNCARHALIRELAKDWAEPFREMVHDLPEDTELREIVLEDWPPVEGGWDNHDGRVTLVGDAAHCMTMFRGEAANHGVIDVSRLAKALLPKDSGAQTPFSLQQAITEYEKEMVERTYPAALKSRQACIDANNFSSVNKSSPLIAKRAMKD